MKKSQQFMRSTNILSIFSPTHPNIQDAGGSHQHLFVDGVAGVLVLVGLGAAREHLHKLLPIQLGEPVYPRSQS